MATARARKFDTLHWVIAIVSGASGLKIIARVVTPYTYNIIQYIVLNNDRRIYFLYRSFSQKCNTEFLNFAATTDLHIFFLPK